MIAPRGMCQRLRACPGTGARVVPSPLIGSRSCFLAHRGNVARGRRAPARDLGLWVVPEMAYWPNAWVTSAGGVWCHASAQACARLSLFTASAGTTMNGGTVTPQSLSTAAFTVPAPSS